MAQKIVDVPGIGEVLLAKRRGAKNIRLSLLPDGRIRVGLPHWLPYSAGIRFAQSRAEWINQHQPKRADVELKQGSLIGKSHRLNFKLDTSAAKVSSRLTANAVNVTSPLPLAELSVQKSILAASERALKKEAAGLLPQRLEQLANQHGFSYKQLKIKRLTSRWGSCSSDKSITLNYFLIQLPWRLIDYVIIHELIHTRHLNHSRQFWQAFERTLPEVKQLRREIKLYRPIVLPN